MENHRLTSEQISESLNEMAYLIASSFGNGSNKKMYAKHDSKLEVWSMGKLVLSTYSPTEAAKVYNELR